MISTLVIALCAPTLTPLAPPALEALQAQERSHSITSLFRAPEAPEIDGCPSVRPNWGPYSEMSLRLGFEDYFLNREIPPVLSEDLWETLLDQFDGDVASIEARLAALSLRSLPLSYELSLEHGGERQVLLTGREPVRASELVVFGEHEVRRAVVDFDVEIAQAATIADPVSARLVTGTSLAMRLLPLPDGSFVAELVARHSKNGENRPIDMGYKAIKGGMRNPIDYEEAGAVVRLLPNRDTELILPARDGGQLKLSMTLDAQAQRQVDSNLVYVPTLATAPAGFLAPVYFDVQIPEEFQDEDWEHEVEEYSLEEAVESLQTGDAWDAVRHYEESGLLLVSGRDAASVRDSLRELALDKAAYVDVQLDVTLRRQEAGSSPKTLATYSAPLVLNLPTGFAAGHSRQTVSDWDVEVAQAARVADPIFGMIEDGVRGTIRVIGKAPKSGATVDGVVEVELDLQFSEFKGFVSRTIQLDQALEGRKTDDAMMPPLPEDRVQIEEPRLSSLEIEGRYELERSGDAKSLVLRRSANKIYGDGSVIEVRISIR